MKKIVLNSITVLVGLVVGIAAGAYLNFAKYDLDYHVVCAYAWARIGLGVSETQFYSRTPEAEKILKNTLCIFEQDAASPRTDSEMRKALRMYCGEFETQLSVLERESGNTDQASLYMAKAQDDFKAVGWNDYSQAKIVQAFRGMPPCAGSNTKAQKPTTQKPCG